MDKKITHLSKIHNRGGGPPWSDLNHDVLFLVMMELGVIDFLSFSGVCKSWRSLALPNKIRFMASKPPMELRISEGPNKTKEYSLVDFGGRSFKILLPESGGRRCVGLTCGYLVLFEVYASDFLLMNPITRHAIRFPKVPDSVRPLYPTRVGLRAILVFSPSIFTWVLVVLCRNSTRIWFSIAGKGEWGSVSSNSGIIDLHEFKGKMYAVDTRSRFYEVELDPWPKLTLLNTKNALGTGLMYWKFVSSGENLYAMEVFSWYDRDYKIHKLDFGEMKWMSKEENTTKDHVFFVSQLTYSVAIRRGLWCECDSWLHHNYRPSADMCINEGIWYFPHDCLKVNFKHE